MVDHAGAKEHRHGDSSEPMHMILDRPGERKETARYQHGAHICERQPILRSLLAIILDRQCVEDGVDFGTRNQTAIRKPRPGPRYMSPTPVVLKPYAPGVWP